MDEWGNTATVAQIRCLVLGNLMEPQRPLQRNTFYTIETINNVTT